MDILDVNEYLYAAHKALDNDTEYKHWFSELVKCREEANKCGFDIGRLEGVMYQLHARDIGFIIDNSEKIKKEVNVIDSIMCKTSDDGLFY